MKRNFLCCLLAVAMCLIPCLGAAACKEKKLEHTHTYAESWSFDETGHWHAATCEHAQARGDAAAHTPAENGKCTVCGYRTTSISLREFAGKTECREMAMKFTHEHLPTSIPGTVAAEMIWFDANEKDELTKLDVIYITESDPIGKVRYESFGFAPVDLDDVAEGTVKSSFGGSHSNLKLFDYNIAEQLERKALWSAVYQSKLSLFGDNVFKLVTLFYEKKDFSLMQDLRLFKIFELNENGFTVYDIQVKASMNMSDEELIAILADRNYLFDFKKDVRTLKTNVYTKLTGFENMQK